MSRLYWFWCYVAFKLYLALPMARSHKTIYGRFTLWLLGYAGGYAYCDNHHDLRDRMKDAAERRSASA